MAHGHSSMPGRGARRLPGSVRFTASGHITCRWIASGCGPTGSPNPVSREFSPPKIRLRLRPRQGGEPTSHLSRPFLKPRPRTRLRHWLVGSPARLPPNPRFPPRLDETGQVRHSPRLRSPLNISGPHSLLRRQQDWPEDVLVLKAAAYEGGSPDPDTSSHGADHHSPPAVAVLDTHLPQAYHGCKRLHISPSHRRTRHEDRHARRLAQNPVGR